MEMNGSAPSTFQRIAKPAAVAAVLLFAYFSVVTKLGYDWWTDENYSHGLLVPFVIGFIIWSESERLRDAVTEGGLWLGCAVVGLATVMLAAGTLGAELFTQRISLIIMLAGIVIYFFGRRMLSMLAVPFVLFLLAIPVPQIVFNRIAFPLQIWASQMAVWGIRLFDIPVLRKGNVMDILPRGSTQLISLEVVEACSGIRSLSTLITLALVLGYFTRRDDSGSSRFSTFCRADLWRTVTLMVCAVPIAVLTNAGRVSATGVLTYYYGKSASEGTFHEISGWLVYVVALAILIIFNELLKRMFGRGQDTGGAERRPPERVLHRSAPLIPILVVIAVSGVAINWFVNRGEVEVQRQMLADLPQTIGEWRQKGIDFRFDAQTESVLRATDYTMRDYVTPEGRQANLYVGYYASQRTGATYHSPQNCLPGAGWVLGDQNTIDISTRGGRTFKANRYTIENGPYREVMIYWYQGRGRTEASEYTDKVNTVWDSVTRRRTDAAMVRIMTSVGNDEPSALAAAADLAGRLSEQLTPFVPE